MYLNDSSGERSWKNDRRRGTPAAVIGESFSERFTCRAGDLRPCIAERDGSVEHERTGNRIGIHAEVPKTLELHARAGQRRRKSGFRLTAVQHFERVGIEEIEKRLSFGRVLRILDGKQA